MSEKLQLSPLKIAIEMSKVDFNVDDLIQAVKNIKPNLDPNQKNIEAILPKIGSEKIAEQLVTNGVINQLPLAWEQVCKMRSCKSKMKL